MPTSTPVPLKPGSVGPIRGLGIQNEIRTIHDITLGTYLTGGAAVTLPAFAKKNGLRLKAINILTPIKPTGAIRYYSWDGSRSTPKIYATVASTGAEVGNSTDLSGVTLSVEFIFGN